MNPPDAIADLCKVDWVALGTWGLALCTLALDLVTLKLYFATRELASSAQKSLGQQATDSKQRAEDSATELKLRLHLAMVEKFDSEHMVLQRAHLARQLYFKGDHDEIREYVMEFFEDLGILHRRQMLDDELTWNAFSVYATRWWAACKEFVVEERKRENDDPTYFIEFEQLAQRMNEREARELGRTLAEVELPTEKIRRFWKVKPP
jgi:hypothetical protein